MKYFEQKLAELQRQATLMIGRGRINVVNDEGNIQIIQAGINVGEIRDNTPRFSEYGFSSNPPPGTDCAMVFLGGDRSQGAIIGTNSTTDRQRNLASGETSIWSKIGQHVYLSTAGIIIEAAGLSVTVNNATTVTINASTDIIMNTPLLQVNGQINATGDIIDNSGTQSHNMSAMRTIYDTHTHNDPQGGVSGPPNQTE